MKVKFGSFEFEPWEADLSVFEEVQQTPRGMNFTRNVRHVISGEVCGATQSAIISRLNAIKNGFASAGNGCGLVDDSNNPIVGHWIDNTSVNPNNISGIQVVASRFPETKLGEFVSGRMFEITVSALFLEPASQIYSYKDSLTRKGNAGPCWVWRRYKEWGWIPIKVSPNTMQEIIHEGIAEGVDNYLLPPAPLYSVPFEQNDERIVSHVGPDAFPEGFAKFVTKWRYRYLLPTYDDVSQPTIAF